MNNFIAKTTIYKVFAGKTTKEIEEYFGCSFDVLKQNVSDFFSTLPLGDERMESFTEKLKSNNDRFMSCLIPQ